MRLLMYFAMCRGPITNKNCMRTSTISNDDSEGSVFYHWRQDEYLMDLETYKLMLSTLYLSSLV